jgi:hypothetical protein
MAQVSTIQETRWGVRLILASKSRGPATVAAMRCHLAFARARAFPAEAACPLYLRGVSIDLSGDGQAIEVRGGDAATASRIREEARELFAPTRELG